MKLKITLAMDNAAFEDNANTEVARILRDIARKIETDQPMNVGARYVGIDANGNGVGEAKVTK